MGEVVPIRQPEQLAEAIVNILDDKKRYLKDRQEIRSRFSSDEAAKNYEGLFTDLLTKKGNEY
jgi:hypothetical protein